MRSAATIILLFAPSAAFAHSNSAGAFWVFLSLPLAGLIAIGISVLFGRKGEIDLFTFLISLFIASPIVAGVGLWLAHEISAAFVQFTQVVPTWVVWAIVIAVISIVSRVIDYRDKKRKASSGGNA
ncbi:MAG: hypothetical protein KIT13_08920 [Burkholderiales bacterium]|nr:hypothetical protein [Burkholderiales bacterium]